MRDICEPNRERAPRLAGLRLFIDHEVTASRPEALRHHYLRGCLQTTRGACLRRGPWLRLVGGHGEAESVLLKSARALRSILNISGLNSNVFRDQSGGLCRENAARSDRWRPPGSRPALHGGHVRAHLAARPWIGMRDQRVLVQRH